MTQIKDTDPFRILDLLPLVGSISSIFLLLITLKSLTLNIIFFSLLFIILYIQYKNETSKILISIVFLMFLWSFIRIPFKLAEQNRTLNNFASKSETGKELGITSKLLGFCLVFPLIISNDVIPEIIISTVKFLLRQLKKFYLWGLECWEYFKVLFDEVYNHIITVWYECWNSFIIWWENIWNINKF
jgi:hypothetical protein